jgi:hypothetical protein
MFVSNTLWASNKPLAVVRAEQPVPGSQQLQLGSLRHQSLTRLKHLSHVISVSRNSGHPDQRPAVQVRVPGLSHRDLETPPKLRDHGPDQRALLLQRMNVTEQDI